jgi:hypothetical protein
MGDVVLGAKWPKVVVFFGCLSTNSDNYACYLAVYEFWLCPDLQSYRKLFVPMNEYHY